MSDERGARAAGASPAEDERCPRCRRRGRPVSRATLESLLVESARSRLRDDRRGAYRFCESHGCSVAYYGSSRSCFVVDEVSVPIFQKSDDPERNVCYCFEHTVRSVGREVSSTGDSDVPERIMVGCRAGLHDCERRNPQGRCCLGNARALVAAGRRASSRTSDDDAAPMAVAPTCSACRVARSTPSDTTAPEEDR